MSPEELVAMLDDFTESVDPCAHGHVEHGENDHIGRRLVHTMSNFLGADWDYNDAVEFIRSADRIGSRELMGHRGALKDGRWIGFAVKREANPSNQEDGNG